MFLECWQVKKKVAMVWVCLHVDKHVNLKLEKIGILAEEGWSRNACIFTCLLYMEIITNISLSHSGALAVTRVVSRTHKSHTAFLTALVYISLWANPKVIGLLWIFWFTPPC